MSKEIKEINEQSIKETLFGAPQITSLDLPYIGDLNPKQKDIGDLLSLINNPEIRMSLFCKGCGAIFAYPDLIADALANNTVSSEEFASIKKEEQYMQTSKCHFCGSSEGVPLGPAVVTFHDFYPKVV